MKLEQARPNCGGLKSQCQDLVDRIKHLNLDPLDRSSDQTFGIHQSRGFGSLKRSSIRERGQNITSWCCGVQKATRNLHSTGMSFLCIPAKHEVQPQARVEVVPFANNSYQKEAEKRHKRCRIRERPGVKKLGRDGPSGVNNGALM